MRLISLNAAVEAARVGEQARVFSLIASEVKSLAAAISTIGQDAQTSMNELLLIATE